MKTYVTPNIRNVALAGHSSAGKTSVAEAMLHVCRHIDRMGRTEDGNTQSDFLPEEIARKISIAASVLPIEMHDVKINVIDLPGFRDFIGEIRNGLSVSGALVMTIDALGGIEVGTEFALELAETYSLPVAFLINKLDKERADFEMALEELRAARPGERFLPLSIPIGKESGVSGVVDLIHMKSVTLKDGKVVTGAIPAELEAAAKTYREAIMDEAAADDESLAEKFLSGEELTPPEILRGLKAGFIARSYHPVFAGAATKAIGIPSLIDFIEVAFPNPTEARGIHVVDRDSREHHDLHFHDEGPVVAYVFKTHSDRFGTNSFIKVISGTLKKDTGLRNFHSEKDERVGHLYVARGKNTDEVGELHAGDIGVLMKLQATHTNDTLGEASATFEVERPEYPKPTVRMAVTAKNSADEDKLGTLLHKNVAHEPTMKVYRDAELHQTIVTGMGDMQLEVLLSKVAAEKIEGELSIPRTAYRETILRRAEGMYRHKKQSGGKGQFGEVHLRVAPGERGSGLQFEWKIVGGVIPTKFEPSVRKGIDNSLPRGIVAGYPVVDVVVECFDGKQHDVDSSDMAFQIASSYCFQQVAKTATPIILEPIYKLRVTVPDAYMGDVMGDLSGRRGRILGQEVNGSKVMIEAQVPLAEMYEYSRQLRSMTQGRGVFEIEYDHYERVPGDIQAKLVEAHSKHEDNGH